ncbi:MAG: phospholipid carrier-dependent glycosyltransferase [Deltaproteobacteria bacterium]|nr:phospholipid carrier-dependent glycosyltransferase [Deltaproteobacteria bacterium]MBW2043134.1 phospholipid carrier-dependent glycosyltransferase [Deltaproteobacteria bacterium]
MSDRVKGGWPLFWIVLLSAALHLAWLDHPRSVVFDEVHFGKYINAYCVTGKRFFDIHPPHAKLFIAGAAAAFGYDGDFGFEQIGKPYGTAPVYGFRLVPALSGIALSMIFFVLLEQLGAGQGAAFLGALLLTLDNALLLQTRIIAIDGVLLAAMFGSLSLFLAARDSRGGRRILLFLLCGGAAGMAVGIKFTGLTALALPGVFAAAAVFIEPKGKTLVRETGQMLCILAGAGIVYVAGWYFHFLLLPAPGPGDAFYTPQGRFFADVFNLHQVMLQYNYFLDKAHTYSSPWWSWPLMARPIFYWSGPKAGIYFLGNPVVWWGGTVAFLCAVAWKVFGLGVEARRQRTETEMTGWLPLAGFAIAYLPHIGIPRILFLYHYLPPLLFSLAFTMPILKRAGWIRHGSVKQQGWGYWGVIALLAAGFLFIAPLTFGWPCPGWYDRIVFGMLFPR